MNMGTFFEWKNDYETGESTVDDQHKYLFHLANRVQSANPIDCNPIIMELYQYTRVHFKAEEDIMKEFKFQELDAHCKLHENLISSLNDMAQGFINTMDDRDDLVAFFGNWIVNHILNEDLRFANFIATSES
jgi:hemerythrin